MRNREGQNLRISPRLATARVRNQVSKAVPLNIHAHCSERFLPRIFFSCMMLELARMCWMDWGCLSSPLSSNTSLSAPLEAPADIVKLRGFPCVNGSVCWRISCEEERMSRADFKRRSAATPSTHRACDNGDGGGWLARANCVTAATMGKRQDMIWAAVIRKTDGIPSFVTRNIYEGSKVGWGGLDIGEVSRSYCEVFGEHSIGYIGWRGAIKVPELHNPARGVLGGGLSQSSSPRKNISGGCLSALVRCYMYTCTLHTSTSASGTCTHSHSFFSYLAQAQTLDCAG